VRPGNGVGAQKLFDINAVANETADCLRELIDQVQINMLSKQR
jgi:hypothetical protein